MQVTLIYGIKIIFITLMGFIMKNILLFLSMCFAFSTGSAATEKIASKDSEIVAYMIVLDKNEIAAAKLTRQKKATKEVNDYAKLMLKEHTKNLNIIEKLRKKQNIKPIDTQVVIALKDKGNEGVNTLTPLVGKAYDTAYIDAMIKGHTDALASINSFVQEAQNAKLKKYLSDTLTHVQSHLAKAEKIQTALH
jgi:putative membrane protein